MPLVLVRYDPADLGLVDHEGLISDHCRDLICGFTACLPAIVAGALHVEDDPAAQLTAVDVEVHANSRRAEDVSVYGVEITILANLHDQRRVTLDGRQQQITTQVRNLLAELFPNVRGLKVAVWVLLCPGSFGEFEIN